MAERAANLAELFAYYYNTVADGVVNDRWREPNMPRNAVADAIGARCRRPHCSGCGRSSPSAASA